MFYQFNDDITTVEADDVSSGSLTAGYVTLSELEKIYEKFSFSRSTVDICLNADNVSRAYTEVYDDYSFAVSALSTQDISIKRKTV